MHKIAVFASGSGSNARKIFEHFKDHPEISVTLLLSNKPNAPVMQHAKDMRIPALSFTREDLYENGRVLDLLREFKIDFIALAGFLWLVPHSLTSAYPDRIVNIHPALLPKYGGKGMYGMNVHRAVKEAAEAVSGMTIHLVNEKYDEGKVLFQATTDLEPADAPEDIAAKVLALEHRHYPQVIQTYIENNL
ncbi:phosphoribosylglycinamide formyltransferase [Roseivirga sp. BDSF3-8]|uniref:phosphoribosylglycinamide formyltransferase n=1 Tax=Roseivirga sp. BDSF3-8 TaxID=3241598 RepID=UPI003531DF41